MPVENIASVVDRIQAIEARIQPDVARTGFHRALVGAVGARAGQAPGDGDVRGFAVSTSAGGPPAITLAQMLGRPVAFTTPTATIGSLPPHGTAGPSALLRLPVEARVSSGFGPRIHPVTGEHKRHAGIDLAAPTGTPIGAAAGGTVVFAGVRGGYGNLVIVDHGDGTETRYAHQASLAVRTGERVAAGDRLGTVGSTGLSTGPHLHFEVRRDGQPVDPAPWLGLP